jgi:protease-4
MLKKLSNILKWIGQHFLGMLFVLIVLVVLMPRSAAPLHPANLQEIELTGPILNAKETLKEIEEARKNPKIKGVLLNVNSPGGAVPPSIEISYAIRDLSTQKPVIAYASGMMTSGAYYASIYAKKIIANPGAIVGSIGVIMESADIEGLMQKIGVKPQVVKEGTYKEAGTFTREWTPQERAELERLTRDTYDLFVNDVAKARHLDINRSSEYADAHIFSAARAQKAGLIDSIGTYHIARKEVEKLAHVAKPVWKKKKKIEQLFEKLGTKAVTTIQSYFYGLKASL